MKEHMECLKEEICEVEKFRKQFFDCTKVWYDSGAAKEHCIQEFGDHVDVIKDLAEAEAELAEALYHIAIVHAMEEAEKEEKKYEEWAEKAGYDHYRYKSGRFAPTGKGHYAGYPRMPHVNLPHMMPGYPVYYDEGEHSGHGDVVVGYGENGMPQYAMDEDSMEHGRAYGRYRAARRHYTETHDVSDKKEMSKHGMDHFGKTLKTISTIWEDVDPEMRKKMRTDLEKLISQMPV